jgi:hypothetical protein
MLSSASMVLAPRDWDDDDFPPLASGHQEQSNDSVSEDDCCE